MAVLIPIGELNAATDVTTAFSIGQAGSRSGVAVDARIAPVAAGIIASDPTVKLAAADAVGEVVESAGVLLEKTLGAVRTLPVTDSIYSEVYLSRDYRRIGGRLIQGGTVGDATEYYEAALPGVDGAEIILTKDFRVREPHADSTGLTPQYVLDEWSTRLGSGGFTAITGWGDSMTTDHADMGKATITYIAEALGVAGVNAGVSGETPYEVAWRAGALDVTVTVPGGSIPASGQVAVNVTPANGWRQAYNYDCVVGTVTGEKITVRLRHDFLENQNDNAVWTIQQLSGTATKRVLPGTRVAPVRESAQELRNPAFIWVGRNDINSGRISTAVTAMLTRLRDSQRRAIVLPVFNRASEPSGSSGYIQVMSVNSAIQAAAGDAFFDARAALIAHGLEIAGITPTTADTTAIGEDRIPPSLHSDATHLNLAGRAALARLVANEIIGRRW